MRNIATFLLVASCLLSYTRNVNSQTGPGTATDNNITKAQEFLKLYNSLAVKDKQALRLAEWRMQTNINPQNIANQVKQKLIHAEFEKEQRQQALEFNLTAMPHNFQRQLAMIMDIGTSALEDKKKLEKLNDIGAAMEGIYGLARACENEADPSTCIEPSPEMALNYSQRLKYWLLWRNATGLKLKDLFIRYFKLANEGVSVLGYNDLGESWRGRYNIDYFESIVKKLFHQVLPLYQQLHAYVRRHLRDFYGEDKFPSTGHIPAHMLGLDWTNVLELVTPFKNKTTFDVTEEMLKQNYTVHKMFKMAEDFFVSLGMEKMDPKFWQNSMFEKPTDGRNVVCQGSAWDFYGWKDFRIKMCTRLLENDLMTIHHEMGHIQYYMNYKRQPMVYRDGANPGFHEAVGDLIALSFKSPGHLYKFGLVPEVPNDNETDINFLMNMALQKFPLLIMAYAIECWRWTVFRGGIFPNRYNKDWWNTLCYLQGISPPVALTENDFDPGTIYHVPAFIPLIRYFLAYIMQFQFHKAACQLAGHKGPLHQCDIYNSTAAGDKIIAMLRLGASKPWPEAMKVLTGQEEMNASALLEYFQPLYDYLRRENKMDVGWGAFCPRN